MTDKKKAEESATTVFDFTVDLELMDELTKTLYYRLDHRAVVRNDDNLRPAGKKLSQTQVEQMLGSTIEEAQIPKKCCGGSS